MCSAGTVSTLVEWGLLSQWTPGVTVPSLRSPVPTLSAQGRWLEDSERGLCLRGWGQMGVSVSPGQTRALAPPHIPTLALRKEKSRTITSGLKLVTGRLSIRIRVPQRWTVKSPERNHP